MPIWHYKGILLIANIIDKSFWFKVNVIKLETRSKYEVRVGYVRALLFLMCNQSCQNRGGDCNQGRIHSWTLGGLNCLSHMKIFLTLLFAIGNITGWGAWPPGLPGSAPNRNTLSLQQNILYGIKIEPFN